MALPRFAALQSCLTNRYMNYIQDDSKFHGYIPFTGDSLLSPFAKVELEKSKSEKGCFHIRCCYNNKYWTRKSTTNGSAIKAESNELEDDKQKNECTLFKVEMLGGNPEQIRMWHQGSGELVFVNKKEGNCLFGTKGPNDDIDNDAAYDFKVIDWDTLFVLPKYVAFKGDNGYYLRGSTIEGHPYLHFASDDPRHYSSQHEILPNPDGTVLIKSRFFDKFWRRSPNWIWADSTYSDTQDDRWKLDCLFWPVKVDDDKVSFRNLGNNNFCSRLTTEGKTSCLNADTPTVRREATLEVEELVLSRKIYNVVFHLNHARIYSERILALGTLTATNYSKTQETVDTLKFSYTKTTTQSWNASISAKLGVQTTFVTGIPYIAEGKIGLSVEVEGGYEWGKTTQITEQLEHTHQVTLRPGTKVVAHLIATQGKCDVPFSYTQRDTLLDGSVVTQDMNDGVYTGGNAYNIKVETKEEPIS